MKIFTNMESVGIYETAIQVKEYIINEVMSGRLGKVMVAWSWPKTIDTQKPRVTKLLPCEDLVVKQSQFFSEFENVIEESNPAEVIGYLCNLWVTTRLFEMLMDTNIAAAAAQAAFLEESVDKMKKERIKTRMKYRKARKNDIDKSLRETFSARMISAQQAVIN
jgi:F0F1-type ATP synthase gamma subunit